MSERDRYVLPDEQAVEQTEPAAPAEVGDAEQAAPVEEPVEIPVNVAGPAEPAAAAAESEEVASLRQEVERYRQEAERNWQQFLHAAADLENYKKTAAKVQRDAVDRTRRQMLHVILTAVDNLERAIRYAEANADNAAVAAILDGLRITHRSLLDSLGNLGVQPLEAAGQKFDPALHEAVAVASAEETGAEPGTVLDVVQQGYLLGQEVLRPARVRVAQ
ncbi:MAG: nucleotide exchange factor GrpE [Armatimonadota bacterium]|nr:nucleotide exchange factor GrpE [Armatimonadota bacterium]MDR5697684.1 nucleotide exchange factor GrpE [Armatimonadota bacterium]